MIKQLNANVKYIGTDDLDLDLFEGQYIVPEGISYNSYLILDQKTAILDTADSRMAEEWKANLTQALEGRQPDFLVVHHMEPDHSALIVWAMESYPGLKLTASAKAIQMLPQFFPGADFAGRTITVKDGDTLELGEHSLQFMSAPMVHWPEVMVSFDKTDGALYSADAFGNSAPLANAASTAGTMTTGAARPAATISTSWANTEAPCKPSSARLQSFPSRAYALSTAPFWKTTWENICGCMTSGAAIPRKPTVSSSPARPSMAERSPWLRSWRRYCGRKAPPRWC